MSRAKFLTDWTLVKRARFNAAKRYERKHSTSTMAFALAGVFGFLIPVYTLLFKDALIPHTKSVLDFTSYVTGALSLILALIEQAKDYPAKARRFDICGRRVNSALRALMVTPSGQDLRPLVAIYERALEDCGDNHDDIDYAIAKAQQALQDGAGAEKKKASRQLRIARWAERFHVYGLYIAVWLAPVTIGIALWLFLPPAAG